MSLFFHEQSYLGVDIGAHGIKLVELHKRKGRPLLWTYGILDEALDIHPPALPEKTTEDLIKEGHGIDFAPDKVKKENVVQDEDKRIEKYAGYLKLLVKKARATTRNVAASLPVSHIFHAVITLPQVPDKEVDNLVNIEIKKLLQKPIDSMQIVHQLIPQTDQDKKKKNIHVLVTAAPKDLVRFYSLIFQRAGLHLNELETEAFALERSLVGNDTAIVMVVDVGAERTNFFIMDQGLPMTHRSIQVGGNTLDHILAKVFGVDDLYAQNLKYDVSSMNLTDEQVSMFDPVMDSIVKEIKYGFDIFLRQLGNENKRPEKIILSGGSGVFPFLISRIEKTFQIKTFVGDPWARVVYQQGVKPLLDTIAPRMSVSVGLALRNLVH